MSVTATSKRAPVLEQRQRLLRGGDGGHVVAGGLQHRREHVAEERRVVDQQHRARRALRRLLLAAEPVLEGERQEMADVDDLGRLALDDGRAEHAGIVAGDLDVEAVLDDVDDLVDHQRHRAGCRRRTPAAAGRPRPSRARSSFMLTSGINWPRYCTMWRPFDSSILRASISSSRVISDSGTALGCVEPARNTSSEVVCSSARGVACLGVARRRPSAR